MALPEETRRDGGRRDTIAEVMRALIRGGATEVRLRGEFQAEERKARTRGLPRASFVAILEDLCDPSARLPASRIDVISDHFEPLGAPRSSGLVDFERFLATFAAALSMEQVLSYLFGQVDLHLAGDARGRERTLSELL
jgi:hypothetical protein